MAKTNYVINTLLGISALAYLAVGYATLHNQFTQLLLLYFVAFAAYLYIINHKINLWAGIAAAIIFRLLLLFSVPNFSDHFYRFIWDGSLMVAGDNPYLYTPLSYLKATATPALNATPELLQQLTSPDQITTYPPLMQGLFWLLVKLFPDNITGSLIVMRLLLIAAETGSIVLLLRLLRKMALPEKHVFLYALNPLVIITLTGNLYLEAFLIFFLLTSLYLVFYQRAAWAGVAFGFAMGIKLLPILFIPLVIKKQGLKQSLYFCFTWLSTLLILYYPLLRLQALEQYVRNVLLSFQGLEFNASLYYLLRWLGARFLVQDPVLIASLILYTLTATAILALAIFRKLNTTKRLMGYMAVALTIFLFSASHVQASYLPLLIALTAVSYFRFAVVWSGLIILAYAAYGHPTPREDLGLVALEYLLVSMWLVVELYLYRQRRKIQNMAND